MSSSERPSPEPLLKKEASPAVLGGDHSGNALEASNALNYRAAALSKGIPGGMAHHYSRDRCEYVNVIGVISRP